MSVDTPYGNSSPGQVSYVPGSGSFTSPDGAVIIAPDGGQAVDGGGTTGTNFATNAGFSTGTTGAIMPGQDGGSTVSTTGTATTGTTGTSTTSTGTSTTGTSTTGSTGGTSSTTGVDAGGTTGTSSTGGPTDGQLHVSFTTVPVGGRYAPRNIGAVWIEDSNGGYVETLARWAATRAGYLTHWANASGGWGGFFGFGGTTEPDAVTSATLNSHETHTLTWKSRNVAGDLMPDGSYTLHIELTDDDRTGPMATIPFQKSAAGFSAMPADAAPYTGLSISYQP